MPLENAEDESRRCLKLIKNKRLYGRTDIKLSQEERKFVASDCVIYVVFQNYTRQNEC